MIAFTKMHGIGNDFVVVDAIRTGRLPDRLPELARRMCDRRFGVGADGLIFALPGRSAPFAMRMLNPDGSESEMCGNGIRCLARFLADHGHAKPGPIPVETGAGTLVLELLPDGRVRVDMGPARLTRGEIGMEGPPEETFVEQPVPGFEPAIAGTAVSMGNPHLVVFVPDAGAVPLEVWGPELERHPLFPNRVNVHFVEVLGRGRLRQRTWERGAGATLACGTGACAAAVAAFRTERGPRQATVSLPGGDLEIEYLESGNVRMTGPAESVYTGFWFAKG
ncbi:MAG: diaminopimelate epimerase [Fimbriimonadaceae bacterium]